jgi:hypothetical protein
MSKCPPGVVCFENFTFTFIIISMAVLGYYVYYRQAQYSINSHPNSNEVSDTKINTLFGIYPRPSFSFSNIQSDVLMNPYAPPLKDDRIIQMTDIRGSIPININTRAVDANYRQVGILKRLNGPEMILPLMGRPLFVRRDKWQYYTMSDQNNQIKLPVSFKSKSCTSEYGCDEISNGDTVYVDGISDTFKVTMYDTATVRYLPTI